MTQFLIVLILYVVAIVVVVRGWSYLSLIIGVALGVFAGIEGERNRSKK
jgi:hypothetical protein